MYRRLVKTALLCMTVAVVSLSGQSAEDQVVTKMDSLLTSMTKPGASRAALSEQLTDMILSAAQRDHAPSRGSVAAFTEVLSGSLAGRDLKPHSGVSQAILEILTPAGANFVKATHLETRLKVLGVDRARIQTITDRYVKIGEQVRGPDDNAVRKLEILRPFK